MTYKKVSIIAIGCNFVVVNGQVRFDYTNSASWRLTSKRRGGVLYYKKNRLVAYAYIPAAVSSKRSFFSVPEV